MTQEHVHDRIEAYVDGELDPAASARIAEHVRSCAACREEMQELQALQRRLLDLQVPDPGPGYWSSFASRVEARLQPAGARAPAHRWERLAGWFFPAGRLAWPRAVGALASVTLLTFLGLRGFRHEVVVPGRYEGPQVAAPAEPGESTTPKGRADVDVAQGKSAGAGRKPETNSGGAARSGAGAPSATGARDSKAGAPAERLGSISKRVSPPAAKSEAPAKNDAGETPVALITDAESNAPRTLPEAVAEGQPGAGLRPEAKQSEKSGFVQPTSPPAPAFAPVPPPPSPTIVPRSVPVPTTTGVLQAPGMAAKAKREAGSARSLAEAEQRVLLVDKPAPADPVARFVGAALAGDSAAARDIYSQLESHRFDASDPEARRDMQQWLDLAPANGATDESRSSERRAVGEPSREVAEVRGSPGSAADVRALLVLDRLIWSRRQSPDFAASVAALAERLAAHADDVRARARAREYLQYLVSSSVDASARRRWETQLQQLPR